MEKDLPKKERINQMMHELEGKMKVLQTELREHT